MSTVTSSTPSQQPNALAELLSAGMWLTFAVALALPATLWWGNDYAGRLGMTASAVAAGLCWAAAVVALVVRTRFPKPQDVVAGTLGAMLVRMVLVVGGGLCVVFVSPRWLEGAFLGQLGFYFLMTLTVETLLAVRWVKNLESAVSAENPGGQSCLPERGAKVV